MNIVEALDRQAAVVAEAQEQQQAQPQTVTAGTTPPSPHYRYFAPLTDAAKDLATQARTLTTGERVYTGLTEFDRAMRGLAPRELMVVGGFAHSGKTVFVTQMVLHNRDARIAWFTPDEDRVLVLSKLVSMAHGVPSEELERRIAAGDKEAEQLVHHTATEWFPNLALFDDISDLDRMTAALYEARDWWGAKEQLVIFDYAGLLGGVGDGDIGSTPAKIDALKAWGKTHACPLVVLHQSSRARGAEGGEFTIDSGAYGGEQQATFLIGVRRKRNALEAKLRDLRTKRPTQQVVDEISEAEYDLQRHQNTITFNLVKNKRPPSRLVGETDYMLERDTGRVRPFRVERAAPQHVQTAWEEDF